MTKARRRHQRPAKRPEEQADAFGPPTVEDVSLDDMVRECERELRQRARVYPKMIERGVMRQDQADRQNLVLEAILERLKDEQAARDGIARFQRGQP